MLVGTITRTFQSTLPVRGATYFGGNVSNTCAVVSIHAPRAGSDIRTAPTPGYEFQSTLPVRGATDQVGGMGGHSEVSIHAPRAGSDCAKFSSVRRCEVSIHAPRAGSDIPGFIHLLNIRLFQSTLPVRGATRRVHRVQLRSRFQSTLPVRGATRFLPGDLAFT